MTTNDSDSGSLDSDPSDSEYPLVRDALRSYSQHLHAEPITPMPEGVWEQIQTSLSLETADHGAGVSDLSVHRQRRLGSKWVGGLVAASVTLLAVGIGANLLSTDDSSTIVANPPQTESLQTESVQSESVQSESAQPESVQSVGESTPQVVQAGFVPPAVTVMSSGIDYNPQNLTETVTRALQQVGVQSPVDYFRVPIQKMSMRGANGMLKSESTLRECITAITKSETSQALLVDQATYMGKEAGIVIIPFAMVNGMDSMLDNSSRVAMGQEILAKDSYLSVLDIWVVGPDCGTIAFDVYSHVTHSLN